MAPRSDDDVLAPKLTWGRYLFVVILILVCIAGMAGVYYKLEHPAPIKMLQDRLFTATAKMPC
jgi:hypothetical protein